MAANRENEQKELRIYLYETALIAADNIVFVKLEERRMMILAVFC
jgi:hypothetical protein